MKEDMASQKMMKTRVDIEIYEKWIARFRAFYGINGYFRRKSICEESKKNLYEQIRYHFKHLNDMYLDEIIWERRVKFKLKGKKHDLLLENKIYNRLNSNDPIFEEDDERLKLNSL